MSELNITELVNAKVVEFGNERFLEGWKGAEERIIKLFEERNAETWANSITWTYVIDLIKGQADLTYNPVKGEK